MPPIPDEQYLANNRERLAEFILQHSPEEIAHLVIELSAVSHTFDCELDSDILRVVGREIAPVNQEYAVSLAEIYIRDYDRATQPPYLIHDLYDALLGKGLPSIESIVWDNLLNDPDDQAFVRHFEAILVIAEDAYDLFKIEDPEVLAHPYTEREHIERMLKLARVKPRYDRIIKEREQRATA